jgi:hypothetical protein
MSERVLRGSRLGSLSYETEGTHEQSAPRQDVVYACPRGHQTVLPFSVDAEVPAGWECRTCGARAERVGAGPDQASKPGKRPRTHWDMLLERRTFDDLEEVLAERLAVLRGDHRKAS